MNLCNKEVSLEEVACDPEKLRINLVNLNTGEIIQKNMTFQFVVNRLFKNELKRLRQYGWKI